MGHYTVYTPELNRYLLVLVFIYFKRAKLRLDEFTEDNFWVALYISQDIEEDATFFRLNCLSPLCLT